MGFESVLLTLSMKVGIVRSFYKQGESRKHVEQMLLRRFNIKLHEEYDCGLIEQIIQSFEETGSVTGQFVYTVKSRGMTASPKKKRTVLPDSFWAKGVNQEMVEVKPVAIEDEEIEVYPVEEDEEEDENETEIEIQMMDYAGVDADPNSESIIVMEMPKSKKSSSPRIYSCKECLTVYPDLQTLRTHKKTHKATEWICELCGKKSHEKRIHKAHMLVHSKEKPHKCEDCDMRFVRLQGLKRHRLTHTGEKPYVCEFCGAAFAAYMSHQMHVRLHTGERPYECKHCKETFIGLPALNTHLKTHGGEYTHHCLYCPNRFKTEKTLREHIQKKHVTEIADEVLGQSTTLDPRLLVEEDEEENHAFEDCEEVVL